MHYKNGREAKNGDKVVGITPKYTGPNGEQLGGVPFSGVLYDAVAGQDYCNGKIALTSPTDHMPNLQDCLHVDDVVAATIPDSTKKLAES